MTAQPITSGTAIGNLAGRAILGGATVEQVKPMMSVLTANAVKLAKNAQRQHKAWQRRQCDFLIGLEEGTINAALYTQAELYALTSAGRAEEIPALIAEWESWEAEDAAQAAQYDEYAIGMAMQADRELFGWDSAVAD